MFGYIFADLGEFIFTRLARRSISGEILIRDDNARY